MAAGIDRYASLGTYTFSGTLAYKSWIQQDHATFEVSGSPIVCRLAHAVTCLGIEDNLAVGITNTFSTADTKVYGWSAWEGAYAVPHNVRYEWYKPNGSKHAEITIPFFTSSSVYYTWSWISTAFMRDSGLWTVKIYLDNVHKKTLSFYYSYSATATPAGELLIGGGSGDEDASMTIVEAGDVYLPIILKNHHQ